MLSRECTTCQVTKPLDAVYFDVHTPPDGFRHECRECRKAKRQTPEFKESQNARRRNRYATDAEHREDIKSRRRERWAIDTKHREESLAYNRRPDVKARKNARRRERRVNDPVWREEQNARQRNRYHDDLEYRKARLAYQKTPEYRERKNARRRTPEYRARENTRLRERRANDPEYRKRQNARWRKRYQSDPEFREKMKAFQKERWANNPELWEVEKARRRERWANDPELRERQNANQRNRRATDPTVREMERANDLVNRYGITIQDYNRMIADQGGICGICQQEPEVMWHVDHDHDTGKVRGLLCDGCNNGLGLFEEEPDLIQSAIQYLGFPEMRPEDIPSLPKIRRFEIPHWKERSRDHNYIRNRNNNLKYNFGITIEQYEELLAREYGTCWICFQPETNKSNKDSEYPDSLSVDHNHCTGLIRGLLCANCNIGLGKFRDDADIMASAIDYLEAHDA